MTTIPEAMAQGVDYLQKGEYKAAVEIFNAVLKLQPNHAHALSGLGVCFLNTDDLVFAIHYTERAIKADASDPAFYSNICDMYCKNEQYDKAVHAGRIAVEMQPDDAVAIRNLAAAYYFNGDTDEAFDCFMESLNIEPNINGYMGVATICQENYSQTDAIKWFKEVLKIDNDYIPAIFALAKSYDKMEEYDKAWDLYHRGCLLKSKDIDVTKDNHEKRLKRIKRLFTPEYIEELRQAANPSDMPIFVCGLPRSGTTLTEQIISSHPDVYGAGELIDLFDLTGYDDNQFPRNIEDMEIGQLKAVARQYIHRLRNYSDGETHVTDKFLANYNHIGLIHCLFPNAKIIVLRRDPMDVLLSCYTHLFNVRQDSTYSIKEMVRVLNCFDELMDYWGEVLPEDAFSEFYYESIIDGGESFMKVLIAECGLEWHEDCARFYENPRKVITASKDQVNKPLYSSSVGRWKNYERHLEKFKSSLRS